MQLRSGHRLGDAVIAFVFFFHCEDLSTLAGLLALRWACYVEKCVVPFKKSIRQTINILRIRETLIPSERLCRKDLFFPFWQHSSEIQQSSLVKDCPHNLQTVALGSGAPASGFHKPRLHEPI